MLTLTAFVSVVYIVCAAITLVAPGFILALSNLWAHALNVEAIANNTPNAVELVAGFVASAIAAAVFSALFVVIWNFFAEQEVKK